MSHKLKADEIDALKNGYEEMSHINIEIAQMCLDADNEALQCCEEYLTRECE